MTNRYRVEKWTHPYPPNPAKLRLELESEGFRVSQWCDSPEAFYGMHKHDSEQTHWVISGSIEITVGNVPHLLSAGDRDRMPANTYHTARVIGEEPVKYLIGEKASAVDAERRIQNSEVLIESMMMMEKITITSQIESDDDEAPTSNEN